jgi:rhodanese-related sulfurtransferase
VKIRIIGCLAIAAFGLACKADVEGLDTLTVAELTEVLANEPATAICDANSADTRSRYGTLPGARLLSNYRDYDPVRELPADKAHPLVFYCHSERCGAAASAARKAIAAGYSRVSVLPAGIRGWSAAGQPVERPVAS